MERVWRSHSASGGAFTSIADTHYGMVVTRFRGKTMLTVRGPETRATPAFGPADAEFVGIQFRPGTFIPHLPARMVMDRRDVNLPEASSKSFWLQGSAWHFPDYENIETFVDWLFQDGLLVHDPVVSAVLRGQVPEVSLRTVQRRFLDATGLTRGAVCQIERARYATTLLKQGVGILDVVHQAGYADQPHMTRALRQMTGLTPAQMMSSDRTPLSFLFKTEPF
ncbi:MAG: AraC family transcriptional regulator [Anaerolineae bacterium]